MVFITLLWSTAGVVIRNLDSAHGFEITFWRSFFTTVALSLHMTLSRGVGFWRTILRPSKIVWVSGICWSFMLSAFMIALTLTTVANVLIIMALGPLITALFAWQFLKHKLLPVTWAAIGAAVLGIVWMFAFGDDASMSLSGSCVAFCIPLCGAINFTLLQYVGLSKAQVANKAGRPANDMEQALLLGAIISSITTLVFAWPFRASLHDLTLLAMLSVFQVAIPCILVIRLSRILPAPEITLLALLEVIFGVTWAWLWASEELSANTLAGGSLVIGALMTNGLTRIIRERRSVNRSSTYSHYDDNP